MNILETRIVPVPGKRGRYALLSMQQTTWYWLDDLASRDYPDGGFNALVRAFAEADTVHKLAETLKSKADAHCAAQMAGLYALSNDNAVPDMPAANVTALPAKKREPKMPTVYQLFRFMPHATTLTTVWERRNYHLR